jgi:hypothetical protein
VVIARYGVGVELPQAGLTLTYLVITWLPFLRCFLLPMHRYMIGHSGDD